jgi:hypothetical protein
MSSADVFEAIMLICFGLAWPLATLKMLRCKSAQGRNLGFTLIILGGYLAGVASKLLGLHWGTGLPPVFWLYVLNSLSVGVNAALQWHFARHAAPCAAPATTG